MSRRHFPLTYCLSALVAAGVFSSRSLAQVPSDVTIKDFAVQANQVFLPFDLFPPDLSFEADKDTVSLVRQGLGEGTQTTLILPRGIYTVTEKRTLYWSQPLGKIVAFTLDYGKATETLRGEGGTALWSFPSGGSVASFYGVQPGTMLHLTLSNEQGNLTVTKRVLASSRKLDQVIGSVPVPILKLTYTTDQQMTDRHQTTFQFLNRSGVQFPSVQAPAEPGTYDLTYRSANGELLKETLVEVWKTERDDADNRLHQPYEVTEYDVDANGKPVGGEQTYFVGKPEQPENTAPPESFPPPIRHPLTPPSFRLVRDSLQNRALHQLKRLMFAEK